MSVCRRIVLSWMILVIFGVTLVSADFGDVLSVIEPDCRGVIDGTIVLQDTEDDTVYRYALCYGEQALEHFGGKQWATAGNDLIDCVERADYVLDSMKSYRIELVPSCPSYGDTLYIYSIEDTTFVATTQSLQDNGINTEEKRDMGSMYITSESDQTSSIKYVAFLLLLILFGFGLWQVIKK